MKIKAFWQAIVWAVIIVVLSFITGDNIDDIQEFPFPNADKILHFIMYFGFSYYLLKGFKQLCGVLRLKFRYFFYSFLIYNIFNRHYFLNTKYMI